jgi:multidrug efflux pump
VQQLGLSVTKSSSSFLMVLAFNSEDGSMSAYDLANYVASHVKDPISRVNGVGTVTLFGSQYAMRIWLDPNKLTNYGLTPVDVTSAITAQNVQIAGGQIGGTPAKPGTVLQATITESTLLQTPEQFGNILLKVNQDGSQVRLKDVARSASAARTTTSTPSTTVSRPPRSASSSRPARTRSRPRRPCARRSTSSHRSSRTAWSSSIRTTRRRSCAVDRGSGQDAARRHRAGVPRDVPVPAEPARDDDPDHRRAGGAARHVRDHGAVGFSINTLSMFGLVLAIGLLVDDAIVVVENVERVMAEEGLSPKEATRKAMGQITGALVGVALVLSAVFVPVAFSGGSVGAIYRQFSLTIVSAMVLSVLVALILTPALCATILKPIPQGHHEEKKGFFGWFNRTFNNSRDKYHAACTT